MPDNQNFPPRKQIKHRKQSNKPLFLKQADPQREDQSRRQLSHLKRLPINLEPLGQNFNEFYVQEGSPIYESIASQKLQSEHSTSRPSIIEHHIKEHDKFSGFDQRESTEIFSTKMIEKNRVNLLINNLIEKKHFTELEQLPSSNTLQDEIWDDDDDGLNKKSSLYLSSMSSEHIERASSNSESKDNKKDRLPSILMNAESFAVYRVSNTKHNPKHRRRYPAEPEGRRTSILFLPMPEERAPKLNSLKKTKGVYTNLKGEREEYNFEKIVEYDSKWYEIIKILARKKDLNGVNPGYYDTVKISPENFGLPKDYRDLPPQFQEAYNLECIMYDKVSKDLKLDKFCVGQSNQSVWGKGYWASLINKRFIKILEMDLCKHRYTSLVS